MAVIELRLTDFTRTVSGGGSFWTETEPSIYVVDSVFPGSTSGTGSLKVNWNGNVSIRWTVGNPPINFGTNIRMGIAIKFLSIYIQNVNRIVRAGLFIGSNTFINIEVRLDPSGYRYFVRHGSNLVVITPNYFEQLIFRQEVFPSLSHYSFSNQNNKSLANVISGGTITYSGQAGFYLLTPSDYSFGSVLFDYFFIEEYTSA